MFDIPIAIFIFKRIEKSVKIVKKIGKVMPQKIYIVSDEGRTPEEKEIVKDCRNAVENSIDWPCEIVKLYADENKGCHNIGMSAMKIFENEPMCIFLEDDNEPADSFFYYCRELLLKYKDDDKILWVCGTNYIKNFKTTDSSDYVFTQHMLPCGWASWANKFNNYYEYDFQHLTEDGIKQARKSYKSNRLFKYDKSHWLSEVTNKKNGRYASWDYHMNFTLRYHNKFGIAPRCNQITNIGVDSLSAHGGTSMDNLLTSKFCMVPNEVLSFPLNHPKKIEIDNKFEKITEKIIVPPRSYYAKIFIRRMIPIPRNISIKQSIKKRKIIRK